MLIEFQNYLTFQNIFLWTNFGIIPFWLLLIFMPNYKITQILINSIILPLILSSLYVYLVYQATLLDESIFDIFKLYLSLDNLYTVFATESFLLIFCDCIFRLGSSSVFLLNSFSSIFLLLESSYLGIENTENMISEIKDEMNIGRTIAAFSGVINLLFLLSESAINFLIKTF